MTCKHNWIEASWAEVFRAKRVNANREYFYHCTRCMQTRFVTLLPKENP